jgi:hypothetical protein
MKVSIASRDWSYQPGEVADVEEPLARTWLANGHAESVPAKTPLTDREINLRDLDADEALSRVCENCLHHRARIAFQGRGLCTSCYRAVREL